MLKHNPKIDSLDDAVLVELAVADNNQTAYAALVERHQSNLRYSMRQLSNWNEALADDLTQEAFIQAFKELHRFRKQAQFSSWLYRIGYNVFLQHSRRKQLKTELLDEHQAETHASNSSPPHEDQLHKKVAALLAQLSPERRSVLHLFLHRQNTQKEISVIMGIPLGTVKTHIARGRLELQAGLKAWPNTVCLNNHE